MAQYLYRGADTETLRETILREGAIEGSESSIYWAAVTRPHKTQTREKLLRDVPTVAGPSLRRTEPVTGGVSKDFWQTKRFTDHLGARVVLDASEVPFERVYYEYDWMNDHPAVVQHISTTSRGVLFVPDPESPSDDTLWATLGVSLSADPPHEKRLKVLQWGPDNIPGTHPDSRFADEQEWVAFQKRVDLSDAIEGVTAVAKADRGSNWALNVYEKLDQPNVPIYTLVPDSRRTVPDEGYADHQLETAYRVTGRGGQPNIKELDPADVPRKFRGYSDG
jgi:hypothetical protein